MISLEYPAPIPFSGIPIPGRNNPFLVIHASLKLRVKISIGNAGCNVGGAVIPGLSSIICRYKARLEEALGARIGMNIEAEAAGLMPRSSLIALLTLAMIEALGLESGYSFSNEEKLSYASILDAASGYRGWPSSLLRAVRESAVLKAPLIYREGEGSIALPRLLNAAAHKCLAIDKPPTLPDESLANAVTHLSGTLTLKTAEAFRKHDLEAIREYWRMEDGLWYSLWGIMPSRNHKIAPDIGGACIIEASEPKST